MIELPGKTRSVVDFLDDTNGSPSDAIHASVRHADAFLSVCRSGGLPFIGISKYCHDGDDWI
jgi:hypothetical protein